MTPFFDFANSRPTLKTYPFFAQMGRSMLYAFGQECVRVCVCAPGAGGQQSITEGYGGR